MLHHTYYTSAVPRPRVEVSAVLGSIPFYAGSALTLSCSVEVDASVDIQYSVTLLWLKSGATISSDVRRMTSNVTQMSPYIYGASLALNPLSTTSDTGIYTCQANIIPGSAEFLVQGASHTDMETITVQGNP